MNRPNPERVDIPGVPAAYEPARPTLVATGVCTLFVAVLSLPMLAGKWLTGPVQWSDQASTGYAFRTWAAEEWKRPPREWIEAKTQFAVVFADRFVL